MNRLHLAALIGLGTLSLTNQSWGQAVSVDATSLMRRLDQIDQRLNSVETRRVATGSGSSSAGGNAYTTADLQRRMDEIEQESSQRDGNLERMNFAIEKLAKRFDDLNKDLDLRLSDVETRLQKLEDRPAATAPAASVPQGTVISTGAGTPVATPKKNVVPADMSAVDHYNKAYAYLTAADYTNAQIWLEEFLKRHPADALADNAYYWLGEVYLVQNNPTAAAVEFRDGLKAFPKGTKAPANMFKMGVALDQLKKPDLAKAIWEQLVKTYPHAPEAARAKEKLLQLKQAPKA